jgi:hypothetical protein
VIKTGRPRTGLATRLAVQGSPVVARGGGFTGVGRKGTPGLGFARS